MLLAPLPRLGPIHEGPLKPRERLHILEAARFNMTRFKMTVSRLIASFSCPLQPSAFFLIPTQSPIRTNSSRLPPIQAARCFHYWWPVPEFCYKPASVPRTSTTCPGKGSAEPQIRLRPPEGKALSLFNGTHGAMAAFSDAPRLYSKPAQVPSATLEPFQSLGLGNHHDMRPPPKIESKSRALAMAHEISPVANALVSGTLGSPGGIRGLSAEPCSKAHAVRPTCRH